MIEKIFIPTVRRVENQITFNNLPDFLKKKVVMVVQAWERDQYHYDCEYLVLPDTDEYHFSHYYCLAKTRKYIYNTAKKLKYAVIDDDITFYRRNRKYFGAESSMEKSRRIATDNDLIEMFSLFSNWLDLDHITVCGCGHVENPPSSKEYSENTSLGSALWINGRDFAHILDTLDITSVKASEDTCFLLSLLTRGYGNRVSSEFVFHNSSAHKKSMKSDVWDAQTHEQTLRDHQHLEKMFPGIYKVVYDENGNRASGGYRGFGKSKVFWNKAYKRSNENSLGKFLDD